MAGFPFRDPRIYGCMRLPGAYRSLPRPSSAPEPSYPPGGLVCRVSVKPFTFNLWLKVKRFHFNPTPWAIGSGMLNTSGPEDPWCLHTRPINGVFYPSPRPPCFTHGGMAA